MLRLIMLVVAISSLALTGAEAAGALRRPEPHPVMAGMSPPLPSVSMPEFAAGDLFGGCGRGRVRDSLTHGCRGPADIR